MINDVRNTVLAILNKNNYGYLSPQDFNLYAQQAQMSLFEDYFYQYNQWINRENLRQSGTGYADIVKGLVEVIDSFSQEVFLAKASTANNTYTLPSDYYLVNKLFYYPKFSEGLPNNSNPVLTPYTGSVTTSGSVTNQLVDTQAGFLNSGVPGFSDGSTTIVAPPAGSIVVNTTTLKSAYVTSVELGSVDTLNLSENIFLLVGDTYSIFNADIIVEVERVSQNKIFYLTLSKGEPSFDSSSSTFQDFELPLSDEPGIIAKICQYAGIEIREADVYNFGKTEQDSDQQIQV